MIPVYWRLHGPQFSNRPLSRQFHEAPETPGFAKVRLPRQLYQAEYTYLVVVEFRKFRPFSGLGKSVERIRKRATFAGAMQFQLVYQWTKKGQRRQSVILSIGQPMTARQAMQLVGRQLAQAGLFIPGRVTLSLRDG